MFAPSFVGVFVNPFYFARKNLYRAVACMAPKLTGLLVDVGCGSKPYENLFLNSDKYSGLEYDTPANRLSKRADYFYDGHTFPFDESSFDGAICNQVLEHVFNPDEFLHEINRVLKLGGKLLLTVPFVWDEHEQPYDYARYSSFGLSALLEKNGFSITEHKKLGADATILFQLTNAYLFKITQSWPRLMKLMFTITVMASINILGIIIGRILPGNPDLFLDHIVLAEKVS
jgi:SAM-dependent methyltransferase